MLKQGVHPQHRCQLSKIKPLIRKARGVLERDEEEFKGQNLDEAGSSHIQDSGEPKNEETTKHEADFQSSMI